MARWVPVAVLLLGGLAAAQSGPPATPPASALTVTPETAYLGGSVLVQGALPPGRGSRTVTITFTPPSPATPFTRTVQLVDDPGGPDHNTFEHEEQALAFAGEWRVSAAGPLPQVPPARGEFTVCSGAAFATGALEAATAGLGEAEEFTSAAEAEVVSFTELPEKAEALEKAAELERLLAELLQASRQVSEALGRADAAAADLDPFVEIREAFTDLARRLETPARRIETARQELHYTHEDMNNSAEWARMFHWQKVGFQKALAIVEYSFGASLSIRAWVAGKLEGAITSVRDTLVDQAAIDLLGLTPAQVAKARQALGDMQQVKGILETHLDPNGSFGDMKKDAAFKAGNWLIDWIATKVGRNCRMYEADLKGEYYCEYYARGKVYMIARYPWEGKLELFFQARRRPTDIVRVEGLIRGNFGWRTGEFYPERTLEDVAGSWGVGIVVPRPPYPQPYDFAVDLEGEGKPHGLELELTEVHYDVEWLKYGLISVLWPAHQLVPAVDLPELRVPGGHWFLTRVTETAGSKKRFEVPLTVDGDRVLLSHTFDRDMDYREAREFRARLKLAIDGRETGI